MPVAEKDDPGEVQGEMFLKKGKIKRNGEPGFAAMCRSGASWDIVIYQKDPTDYAFGGRKVLEGYCVDSGDERSKKLLGSIEGDGVWGEYEAPGYIMHEMGWEYEVESGEELLEIQSEVTDKTNLYKTLREALGKEHEYISKNTMMGAKSNRRWDCGCLCEREAFMGGTLFDSIEVCSEHQHLFEEESRKTAG